jgi:hypothetical protein
MINTLDSIMIFVLTSEWIISSTTHLNSKSKFLQMGMQGHFVLLFLPVLVFFNKKRKRRGIFDLVEGEEERMKCELDN